jgi:anti-sigma28 factor (negative regulator of flagellin synthesis)
MDIQDVGTGKVGRSAVERVGDAIDLTRANRERIHEAVREIEEQRRLDSARQADRTDPPARSAARAARRTPDQEGDHVELSALARALAAEEDPAVAQRRRERVAALRREREDGTLDDPGRADRAARQMLRGAS